MQFNEICSAENVNEALFDLLKVLAIDNKSEALLKIILNEVKSVEMEDDALVVELADDESLYIFPPTEGDTFAKQPARYQELSKSFSGLSHPDPEDLGLHFGVFAIDSDYPEIIHSFSPIQEYDNWYYYDTDNALCYISHEGGSGERAEHPDTGVTFLHELAAVLSIDTDA